MSTSEETIFQAGFENAAGITTDMSGPIPKILLSTGSGSEAEIYPLGACVTAFKVLIPHFQRFADATVDRNSPVTLV
ncbi:unnamed protein product, partial [Phaeothamnion confervicola]